MINSYSKRYLEVEDSRKFTAAVTRYYFNGSIITSKKQDVCNKKIVEILIVFIDSYLIDFEFLVSR